MLFLVIRLEQNQEFTAALREDDLRRQPSLARLQARHGYLLWEKDFPRTASMKIKRTALADEIGKTKDRAAILEL